MLQYDIIGDVHGHADKLEMLLQKLGYFRKDGVYRHLKNRKVIFLGDLIDRGPKIRETLHIAKDMCDAGNALIVMGNHEFNAISFHTPHTEKGGFFRNHEIDEIEQHIETLRAFRHFQSEWEMFLNWFKTIPLYLDLEALRCVHACWKPAHIKWLKKHYEGMTAKFLSITNNKRSKSRAYSVLNETLKGIEYKLPKPLSLTKTGWENCCSTVHLNTRRRLLLKMTICIDTTTMYPFFSATTGCREIL